MSLVNRTFAEMVDSEVARAREKFPPLNSAHEAYAVILEEVDELWEEVRKKRDMRNKAHMAAELVQIASMCRRAAEDLDLVESEDYVDERAEHREVEKAERGRL